MLVRFDGEGGRWEIFGFMVAIFIIMVFILLKLAGMRFIQIVGEADRLLNISNCSNI